MVDEIVRSIASKAKGRFEILSKLDAASIEFEDRSSEFGFSRDFLQRIIDSEGIRETCVLTNLYDGSRQVCATPVYSSTTGQVVGVVLISTPISEVIQSTTRVSNFYLAAIALIMVMICALTLYISRQQGSPLRELARTARAFGHGDLNARVQLQGKQPEADTGRYHRCQG